MIKLESLYSASFKSQYTGNHDKVHTNSKSFSLYALIHSGVFYSSISQTVGSDPKVGRELLSSGSSKFFGNIYFLSFICKLDKNTVYLLPQFSKFSIEPQNVNA